MKKIIGLFILLLSSYGTAQAGAITGSVDISGVLGVNSGVVVNHSGGFISTTDAAATSSTPTRVSVSGVSVGSTISFGSYTFTLNEVFGPTASAVPGMSTVSGRGDLTYGTESVFATLSMPVYFSL